LLRGLVREFVAGRYGLLLPSTTIITDQILESFQGRCSSNIPSSVSIQRMMVNFDIAGVVELTIDGNRTIDGHPACP
jgi:hypothetical protein